MGRQAGEGRGEKACSTPASSLPSPPLAHWLPGEAYAVLSDPTKRRQYAAGATFTGGELDVDQARRGMGEVMAIVTGGEEDEEWRVLRAFSDTRVTSCVSSCSSPLLQGDDEGGSGGPGMRMHRGGGGMGGGMGGGIPSEAGGGLRREEEEEGASLPHLAPLPPPSPLIALPRQWIYLRCLWPAAWGAWAVWGAACQWEGGAWVGAGGGDTSPRGHRHSLKAAGVDSCCWRMPQSRLRRRSGCTGTPPRHCHWQ